MSSKKKLPLNLPAWAWLITILVLPFGLWLLWGTVIISYVIRFWSHSTPLQDLGQAGDLFGGVNALFAAYAFAGVAVAAWYQKQTFELVEEQQKVQGFEPLFFKLLETLKHSEPTLLRGSQSTAAVATEDYVNAFASRIHLACVLKKPGGIEPTPAEKRERLDQIMKTLKETNPALGAYFRTLALTLELVTTSGLPSRRKVICANILRASLSPHMQFLILVEAAAIGKTLAERVAEYGTLRGLQFQGPPLKQAIEELVSLVSETAFMTTKRRREHNRDHPDSEQD